MILSDTAVRQRISVMVLAVIVLVFGLYCYSVLPRESEPDITIPYVFVSTSYKGVSPSDIETSITPTSTFPFWSRTLKMLYCLYNEKQ